MRIRDLAVRVEGSPLEARVAKLYGELEARGLPIRPPCYLGDEWFSPEGEPTIAIPFYLAHPRLEQLELRQMMEVEGGTAESCAQLLRHECGHAVDHAYRFSSRRSWRAVFGSPNVDYEPERYRPRPYSRSFVRHLPNWYAQAHPDEDFAETFAVWLVDARRRVARPLPGVARRSRSWSTSTRSCATRARSRRSSRRAAAGGAPTPRSSRRRSPTTTRPGASCRPRSTRTSTTRTCGASSRRRPRVTAPRRPSCGGGAKRSSAPWCGGRASASTSSTVSRASSCSGAPRLGLHARGDEVALALEVGAYVASLVTNHLHTGRFKRSV